MLDICKSFFEYLNGAGVRYCHWKSNFNLDRSLSGRTDLDLLVALPCRQVFEQALLLFGMKKLVSPPEKAFPGLEDYLGFDQATGALVHLHVHYSLVLGEKFIKNHRLPLDDLFFEYLVMSPKGLWIPCPELELIILVLRAHLKADLASIVKHQLKSFLGQRYNPFPDHIHQEFLWLLRGCDLEKARSIYRESRLPVGEEVVFGFIRDVSQGRLRAVNLLKRKLAILHGLRGYTRRPPARAYLDYFIQYLRRLPPLDLLCSPGKKTVAGNGKVFALVGADGSGKSTLVRDLEKWLSWKLCVRQVYLGIPKGRLVQGGFELVRTLGRVGLRRVANALEVRLWLSVARSRVAVTRNAAALAAGGEVVLSDRFPLEDFHDMEHPMDGPRLSRSCSPLAATEAECYRSLSRPDCIIVLKVALEELRKRKTDLPLETHREKAQAVNSVAPRAGVVVVNANESYENVLLQVKRLIWQELTAAPAAEACCCAPSPVRQAGARGESF